MANAAEGKRRNENDRLKGHRGAGPKPLVASLRPVAIRALGRRSMAEQGLIAEWSEIVGFEVARHCLPRKLTFPGRDGRRDGVLTLRVEPAWALELQHLTPQLIERVNGYFGYPAVAQVRFRQGPVRTAPKPERKTPRPLDTDEESALQERTKGLENRGLAEALTRLGRNVLGRR